MKTVFGERPAPLGGFAIQALEDFRVTLACGVSLKDHSDDACLALIDNILPVLDVITQWGAPAAAKPLFGSLHHAGHRFFAGVQDHVLAQARRNKLG